MGECLSNKNNNIKEEKNKKIEKYQIIKYSTKCNFYYKEILPIVLNSDLSKNEKIKILKIVKRIEMKITKHKPIIKTYLNSKKKLEYNKIFDTYIYELLELIKINNNSLMLKEVI